MNFKKCISIIMVLIVNVAVVFGDISLKNDNDLYLQINLFSYEYQTLNGDEIFRYDQLFGPKDDFINYISINEDITSKLDSAEKDRKFGNILYWSGLGTMIGGSIAIIAMDPEDLNLPLYLSNLAISTVVSFIGIKFFSNAISNTNRAVTIFNSNN